jgi:hypothetical protein
MCTRLLLLLLLLACATAALAAEASDVDPDAAASLRKPSRNLDMIGPMISAEMRAMRNANNGVNPGAVPQSLLSPQDIRSMVARHVPLNVNVCSVVDSGIRGSAQAPKLTNSRIDMNCAVNNLAVGR